MVGGSVRTPVQAVGGVVLVQVRSFCVCIWTNFAPSVVIGDDTQADAYGLRLVGGLSRRCRRGAATHCWCVKVDVLSLD